MSHTLYFNLMLKHQHFHITSHTLVSNRSAAIRRQWLLLNDYRLFETNDFPNKTQQPFGLLCDNTHTAPIIRFAFLLLLLLGLCYSWTVGFVLVRWIWCVCICGPLSMGSASANAFRSYKDAKSCYMDSDSGVIVSNLWSGIANPKWIGVGGLWGISFNDRFDAFCCAFFFC